MTLKTLVENGYDPNVNPFRMPPDNDIFQRRDQERLRKKQVIFFICSFLLFFGHKYGRYVTYAYGAAFFKKKLKFFLQILSNKNKAQGI